MNSEEKSRQQSTIDAKQGIEHPPTIMIVDDEASVQSQEFLANLTDMLADAVFSIKIPEYQIEYVNQAVDQIFGYQPAELLGQSIHILYPDLANFEIFAEKQAVAIAAGQSQMRLEQLLRRKDDKLIWTETATTFVYADGRLSKLISVVRDITERSLLLGVVAHELHNPLALLKGFSEVLVENPEQIDAADMTKYLTHINNIATRMFTILNDLLDVTKIELGQISLITELVDLKDLLKTHMTGYFHIAHKKRMTLVENFTPEALICECDPAKIGQVVSNFIDNALKYSPPDTKIEIIGERRASTIWVGVKDEGPGIKPAEIQHLFKSFGKTSSLPTAGEKSTGLGLAICKRIIEVHHGKIGVESRPGQGATFWFSLPLKAPIF